MAYRHRWTCLLLLVLAGCGSRKALLPNPSPRTISAVRYKIKSMGFKTPDGFIDATLAADVFEEIIVRVLREPDIDHRIVFITIVRPGEANVFVGEQRGPRGAMGTSLRLRKVRGRWRIVSKNSWVS